MVKKGKGKGGKKGTKVKERWNMNATYWESDDNREYGAFMGKKLL